MVLVQTQTCRQMKKHTEDLTVNTYSYRHIHFDKDAKYTLEKKTTSSTKTGYLLAEE